MKEIIPTFESYMYSDALFELSNNSTLYHRSPIKLNVGDTIVPKKKGASHWLESNACELAMEQMRKERYSDRPSRFDCVYASVHPRSRFVDKGFLYAIRPVGNMFMTDSVLIDVINEQFDRTLMDNYLDYDDQKELIDKAKNGDKRALDELMYMLPYEAKLYWEGKRRTNIKDIEVLCDSAIVTEEIVDSPRLRTGMDVTVSKEGLKARLNVYVNSKHNCKRIFTDEEVKALFSKIKEEIFAPGADIKETVEEGKGKDGSNDYRLDATGTLKVGAKLNVLFVQSSITMNTVNRSYGDDTNTSTKYRQIMFDFYLDGHLYKRKDEAPLFRFETFDFMNRGVYDIGKFLK